MHIVEAKKRLSSLDADNKYETMLMTAGIITKMLEKKKIKPIIVGGLSVEIYTQQEYSTRDIDFVSDGHLVIKELLLSLDFLIENRHFYRKDIEIAVEIPDNYLDGNIDKVSKIDIGEGLYVYLISVEDIIIDRLRALLHWHSEEDGYWGFTMLANNFNIIDIKYIKNQLKNKKEKEEFDDWLRSYYSNQ